MKEYRAGRAPASRGLIPPTPVPLFTTARPSVLGAAGAGAREGCGGRVLAVGTHLVAAAGQARVPLGQDALHPQEKRPLDLVLWDGGKAEVG